MTVPADGQPRVETRLDLEQALELLGALEEARDALMTTGHLTEAAVVVAQIQLLSRKLGFESPEGGPDVS